jgi:hypothetical protein
MPIFKETNNNPAPSGPSTQQNTSSYTVNSTSNTPLVRIPANRPPPIPIVEELIENTQLDVIRLTAAIATLGHMTPDNENDLYELRHQLLCALEYLGRFSDEAYATYLRFSDEVEETYLG